jgi:tellurite resistance protein TerC
MLPLWIIFFLLVALLLALDLGVLHKEDHVVSVREALGMTVMWVTVGTGFSLVVYFMYEYHWFQSGISGYDPPIDGSRAWIDYMAGYLVEESLSVDNIFVIALLLRYFRVPGQHQHRVLFWGILGAIVLRGVMIAVGTWLVHSFDWIFYVFGALLVYAAVKMLMLKEEDVDPERGMVLRLSRKILRVSPTMLGSRFLTRIDGRRYVTPLFLVLLVIEATDVLFAVDSIPAIFEFTIDPFLVLSSNVFAILGLRSLYFVLAGMMHKFRYLTYALASILIMIGGKMLAHKWIAQVLPDKKLGNLISLGAIVLFLTVGVLASLYADRRAVKAAQKALEKAPPGAGTAEASRSAAPGQDPARKDGAG